MGYMIPYTNYTYQEYARRMDGNKHRPHYVRRPYKAVFHDINDGDPSDLHTHLKGWKQKRGKKNKASAIRMSESDKFIVTGKGGLFNEIV